MDGTTTATQHSYSHCYSSTYLRHHKIPFQIDKEGRSSSRSIILQFVLVSSFQRPLNRCRSSMSNAIGRQVDIYQTNTAATGPTILFVACGW
jgi:hypothetical protein